MTAALVDADARALLQATARSFVLERLPISELRRQRTHSEPVGVPADLWQAIADLDWLGLPFPERVGGSDAGVTALGVVVAELGRTLAPTPILSVALSGLCLAASPMASAQQLLADMIGGGIITTLAHQEESRYRDLQLSTTVTRTATGFRLSGRKRFVPDAAYAHQLLVPARQPSAPPGTGGLYAVNVASAGVRLRHHRLVDSRWYSDVELHDVAVSRSQEVLPPEMAASVVAERLDHATCLLATEMVATAAAAFALTVDHLSTREQFGVVLSSFQALRHRVARMFVELQLAEALVDEALQGIDDGTSDAVCLASTAKCYANDVIRNITAEAVQLHGGIGITDDADVGLYLKRARVAGELLGTSDFHRDRFATASGY